MKIPGFPESQTSWNRSLLECSALVGLVAVESWLVLQVISRIAVALNELAGAS